MNDANIRNGRDQALDFTKGMLVLLMVLYHWINYFVSTEGLIFRYIRFITPSFIFITGFLIAHVYLARYDIRDVHLRKRLLERGAKLLVLFTMLNLAAALMVSTKYNGTALGITTFADKWFSIYVTGNGGGAVFQVLVPISYILILAAGLLRVRVWIPFPFHAACAGLAGVILMAHLFGLKSGNLELIGVGFIGVFFGGVGMERIYRWISRPTLVISGYMAYIIAVSLWNVLYPIQILGVCFSLLLIYAAGARWTSPGMVLEGILVLGHHTLLTYIWQIFVLQLLLTGLRAYEPVWMKLVLSLAAVFILTQSIAEAAEFMRSRSKKMDRLYRAVLA